jgi:hypothetical protein
LASKNYQNVLSKYFVIALVLAILTSSCQNTSEGTNGELVVTAFDQTLTMGEIESMLGPNMTRQDSFFFIKEYIDNWVQKQVILNNALNNNMGNTDEINTKVENYRNDLITFEFLKKKLAEKLDTNITLGETKAYYEQHPENFELKQNIIRFVFIKMPVALEKKHNFWSKFGKADEETLTKMAVIALKNGGNAFMGKDKWIAFDDILKVVPINTYNQESFINNNRLFKIEETNYIWYINILDFRIKDNTSPFEFVEENITQILLNKRKVQLMEKLETQMVKNAMKDNQVKINLPQYE